MARQIAGGGMLMVWMVMVLLAGSVAGGGPLEVFDAPEFGSPGVTLPSMGQIYAEAELPGGLDNAISSLRLAKGYKLVAAANADGTGPSRCWVAHRYDLEIGQLPAELDDAISFIRVLPWNYGVTKKGTGGNVAGVGAGWYYNWGPNGETTAQREFVPMSWGWTGALAERIAGYVGLGAGHLLSFNEADNCNDQSGQYYDLCVPAVAAARHVELMKAGVRLGSPGGRERTELNWLANFKNELDALDGRMDFLAIHWYDWGNWSSTHNANPDSAAVFARFRNQLSQDWHKYRMPIWITEFNANINRPREVQDAFLELALPYLEKCGYVERYAYFQPFSGTGDFFDDTTGAITSTGQIYLDQASRPAWASEQLPYPWRTRDVGAVAKAGSTLESDGVWTVCASGEDIWFARDEFRYVYRPMRGDGQVVAQVWSMTGPDPWAKAGVMVRGSLAQDAAHAMMVVSSDRGAAFQYRSAAGGQMLGSTQTGPAAPYWVKLVRQGETVTGYRSADGQGWTQVGSAAVALGEEAYVGLCVTAHKDGAFCDVIFTDFSTTWEPPAGDADGDWDVDLADLAAMANHWLAGRCAQIEGCDMADVNGDGTVNLAELASYCANWGR